MSINFTGYKNNFPKNGCLIALSNETVRLGRGGGGGWEGNKKKSNYLKPLCAAPKVTIYVITFSTALERKHLVSLGLQAKFTLSTSSGAFIKYFNVVKSRFSCNNNI